MPLSFDAISSLNSTPEKPGGVRDLALDLSGALKEGETLLGPPQLAVTPDSESQLRVVNVAVNTTEIEGAAPGRAVLFRVETLQEFSRVVRIDVDWEGSQGTSDTHELLLPVTRKLTN